MKKNILTASLLTLTALATSNAQACMGVPQEQIDKQQMECFVRFSAGQYVKPIYKENHTLIKPDNINLYFKDSEANKWVIEDITNPKGYSYVFNFDYIISKGKGNENTTLSSGIILQLSQQNLTVVGPRSLTSNIRTVDYKMNLISVGNYIKLMGPFYSKEERENHLVFSYGAAIGFTHNLLEHEVYVFDSNLLYKKEQRFYILESKMFSALFAEVEVNAKYNNLLIGASAIYNKNVLTYGVKIGVEF